MDNIKREIKRLVKMLRDNGASEEEIRELFKEEKKQLERLVVTNDHKLFVGEKEVLLRPICMAAYLLFLRHPEGIRFKELPDYREELAEIYHSMKRKTRLNGALLTLLIRSIIPSLRSVPGSKMRLSR